MIAYRDCGISRRREFTGKATRILRSNIQPGTLKIVSQKCTRADTCLVSLSRLENAFLCSGTIFFLKINIGKDRYHNTVGVTFKPYNELNLKYAILIYDKMSLTRKLKVSPTTRKEGDTLQLTILTTIKYFTKHYMKERTEGKSSSL